LYNGEWTINPEGLSRGYSDLQRRNLEFDSINETQKEHIMREGMHVQGRGAYLYGGDKKGSRGKG